MFFHRTPSPTCTVPGAGGAPRRPGARGPAGPRAARWCDDGGGRGANKGPLEPWPRVARVPDLGPWGLSLQSVVLGVPMGDAPSGLG